MSIVRTIELNEITIEDALTFAALGLRLECNNGEVTAVVEE